MKIRKRPQDRPEDRKQPPLQEGQPLEDQTLEGVTGGLGSFESFPRVPTQRVDYKLRREG